MWARIASALIGVWLMAAPAVLGYEDPARTSDRIAGPVAATVAIVAIWEVTRPVRWANLLIAGWLLIVPMVLDYHRVAALNSVAAGLLLAALTFVRGALRQRFGGGWSALIHPRR
jgi:hypothetical protein